jgi:uncharacterized protein (DUF58 family)
LNPGALEADYDLIGEWARHNKRRSLFVVMTSVSNPASLEALHRALKPITRRHLPVVMAIADRDLQGLVQEPAHNLDEA